MKLGLRTVFPVHSVNPMEGFLVLVKNTNADQQTILRKGFKKLCKELHHDWGQQAKLRRFFFPPF